MVDHLDYLVSAAALILFDQESPSPPTYLNNCVVFITEILDFSCCFSESPSKMLRFASSAAKNLESLPSLEYLCNYKKPQSITAIMEDAANTGTNGILFCSFCTRCPRKNRKQTLEQIFHTKIQINPNIPIDANQ